MEGEVYPSRDQSWTEALTASHSDFVKPVRSIDRLGLTSPSMWFPPCFALFIREKLVALDPISLQSITASCVGTSGASAFTFSNKLARRHLRAGSTGYSAWDP